MPAQAEVIGIIEAKRMVLVIIVSGEIGGERMRVLWDSEAADELIWECRCLEPRRYSFGNRFFCEIVLKSTRQALHMKSGRSAPVGRVFEGAIAIRPGGFGEADGVACLIHLVVEVPRAAEDDGGGEGEVVAVLGEVGIVEGEFLDGAGEAGVGEEEDAGHGEWRLDLFGKGG